MMLWLIDILYRIGGYDTSSPDWIHPPKRGEAR